MAVVLNSVPTFLLRRVNPADVIQKYNQGHFKTVVVSKTITHKSQTQTAMGNQIATNLENNVYGYRTKSNNIQVIATTNCKPYVEFISSESGMPVMGGKCRWCKRNFTHQAIGVPIKSVKIDNKIIVYYTNIACRFGCAFALWKSMYNKMMLRRDSQFINGEIILKYIFSLQCPERELHEAPDPDLLKVNGGSLDDSEYDNDNYIYLNNHSFIWAPVKEQHMRFANV